MRTTELDLRLASVGVPQGSAWIGRCIQDIPELFTADVILLGLKRAEGDVVVNPPKNTVLREDDLLVVLGTEAQVGDAMERVAASMR